MATRYSYEDGEDFSGPGYGTSKFTAATKGTTFADLNTYDLISSKYGQLQTFEAPLSNKGNATSQISSKTNTFAVSPQTSVRLVDNATGDVVFEGVGYDAAQKARDLAQELTDANGRKANWDIQAATPGMKNYATVAHEAPNNSPIGTILDIGLPILANALLPGSGFLGQALGKVGATMAASALGSAASGTLQGKSIGDIAKSAGLSAATAGLLKGTPIGGYLDKAVSNIPVVGDVAKGVSKAVGSIPSLDKLVGAGTGALSNAFADEIVVNALRPVTSSLAGSALSSSLANSIAGKYPAYQPTTQSPLMQQPPETPYTDTLSDLTVTGTRLPNVSSFAVSPAAQSLLDQYAVKPSEPPAAQERAAEQTTEETPAATQDEIVVTAQNQLPVVNPFAVDLSTQNLINDYAAPPSVKPIEQPVQQEEQPDTAKDEIVVTAQNQLPVVNPFAVDLSTQNLINDYAVKPAEQPVQQEEEPDTAKDEIVVTGTKNLLPPSLLTPAVTAAADAANATKGETPYDADRQSMTDEETAAVNAAAKTGLFAGMTAEQIAAYLKLAGFAVGTVGSLVGGGGSGGKGVGKIPGGLGGVDPTFSAKLPTANIPGGVGAASNLAVRPMGEPDWLTYGERPELSFFDYVPKGMSHGGPMGYSRGSSRESFAVEGPGTGRSDDIPAVLSDGEYVVDAETVALLGDGSSKAGAKKLDDLRVKVRKHKGQKLAQGRFSANAKNPEAYLSGGRI